MIVEWTTGDGRTAEVTVNLVTSSIVDADGDKITVACCEIDITAKISGAFVGSGRPQAVNHPVAVAKIGKLGITADNLARVNAAIAGIEASPEWQAKLARKAKAEEAERDYDAHRARMRKVMGY